MAITTRLAACALGALAIGTPALGANFNYNQLDLGISYIGADDIDLDGLGLVAEGSWEMRQYLIGKAAIHASGITLDGEDYAQQLHLNLGLGTALPLGDRIDFLAGASFLRVNVDYEYYSNASDNGYSLNAGFRGLVGERFDWTVVADYYDWGGGADGIAVTAGFRVPFTEKFGMGLDFTRDFEAKSFRAVLDFRLAFKASD
jgi:hypothetical protein